MNGLLVALIGVIASVLGVVGIALTRYSSFASRDEEREQRW